MGGWASMKIDIPDGTRFAVRSARFIENNNGFYSSSGRDCRMVQRKSVE